MKDKWRRIMSKNRWSKSSARLSKPSKSNALISKPVTKFLRHFSIASTLNRYSMVQKAPVKMFWFHRHRCNPRLTMS